LIGSRPIGGLRCTRAWRDSKAGLFETEEDLRKGDAALNEMSPSGPDVGTRTSVEIYEVGADLRMPATTG
jgi:hypothetical protein